MSSTRSNQDTTISETKTNSDKTLITGSQGNFSNYRSPIINCLGDDVMILESVNQHWQTLVAKGDLLRKLQKDGHVVRFFHWEEPIKNLYANEILCNDDRVKLNDLVIQLPHAIDIFLEKFSEELNLQFELDERIPSHKLTGAEGNGSCERLDQNVILSVGYMKKAKDALFLFEHPSAMRALQGMIDQQAMFARNDIFYSLVKAFYSASGPCMLNVNFAKKDFVVTDFSKKSDKQKNPVFIRPNRKKIIELTWLMKRWLEHFEPRILKRRKVQTQKTGEKSQQPSRSAMRLLAQEKNKLQDSKRSESNNWRSRLSKNTDSMLTLSLKMISAKVFIITGTAELAKYSSTDKENELLSLLVQLIEENLAFKSTMTEIKSQNPNIDLINSHIDLMVKDDGVAKLSATILEQIDQSNLNHQGMVDTLLVIMKMMDTIKCIFTNIKQLLNQNHDSFNIHQQSSDYIYSLLNVANSTGSNDLVNLVCAQYGVNPAILDPNFGVDEEKAGITADLDTSRSLRF